MTGQAAYVGKMEVSLSGRMLRVLDSEDQIHGIFEWTENRNIHNILAKQMERTDGSFRCRPRRLHRHYPKLVNVAPRKRNHCLVVFDLLEYEWGSSSTRKEFDKIELMSCR